MEIFKVGRWSVTSKTVLVAVGAWVALSRGMTTLIPALFGFLWAAVWHSDIVSVQHWRLPKALAWVGTNLVLPIIASAPPGYHAQAERLQQEHQRAREEAVLRDFRRWVDAQRQNGGIQLPGAGAGAGGEGGGGGGGPQPEPMMPPHEAIPRAEPEPEKVQRLVDMGFDREMAERALADTHNNEEAAVARLVG